MPNARQSTMGVKM